MENNKVLYIITNKQNPLNYRVQKILELSPLFSKMVLVTRDGEIRDENHLVIGSYLNPTGIFRKIGLNKLKSLIDKYLFFPSTLVLFVKKANRILKQKIKHDLDHNKHVVILTTLPPHDISLIGLYLKRKFPQIKWIIDWQDLWTFDEYYFSRIPKIYRNKLKKIERRLFKICDINITSNSFAKKVLLEKYHVPENKVIAIPHPFDSEEIDDINIENKQDKNIINIGFLGNIHKPPKLLGDKVLRIFNILHDSGIKLKVRIIGDESPETKNIVKDINSGFIEMYKHIVHNESLKQIAKCDFLLIALSDVSNAKIIMHAKLSHYLMLKRPILAFVPEDSFVAQVIKTTKTGYVIPNFENSINCLKIILDNFNFDNYLKNRNEEEINKYSWKNIQKEWLKIIKNEKIIFNR